MPNAALVRSGAVLAIAAISLWLILSLFGVLGLMRGSLILIIASTFLAYAIAPVVAFYRRTSPLTVAVGMAYLTLLLIVALVLFVLVPPIIDQAQQFANDFPGIVKRSIDSIETSGVLRRLPPEAAAKVDQLPSELTKLAAQYGPALAQQSVGFFASFASVLLALVIVPVLSAYALFDAVELRRAVVGLVPPQHRPRALALIADINDVLGGFIRGQLLDGLIVGTLIWIMLSFNHVPFALLIGVTAGVLNLVPYLGAIVGFVPSVLLALTYNGWKSALLVAALFAVIQQLDGNVIVPRIMQANVSLSPVVLVVSILVFSDLFGLLGTVIAVPFAAVLRVIKLHFAPAPPEQEIDEDLARAQHLRRFS